jgi:hypothetical protein
MDASDNVWPSYVQDLVATLKSLEIVQTGVGGLEHGSHSAIGYQNPL